MKIIQLVNNKGELLVDDEDFDSMSKYKWYLIERKYLKHAYRSASAKEKRDLNYPSTIYAHKQLTNTIKLSTIIVDHIDHNGLNNQRSNLKSGNKINNQRNQRKHKIGSSKFKGVCWNKVYGKWQVEITVNYIRIGLGYFDNEIEAAKAYNRAADKYYGDDAYLNQL